MNVSPKSGIALLALVSLLWGADVVAMAAPPQAIWKKGRDITGTCQVKVAGKVLMNGECGGVGHGRVLTVSAPHDGCTIDLTRTPQGVTGDIYAYKDGCGDLDTGVSLGAFKPDGNCWRAASARVCLHPGRFNDPLRDLLHKSKTPGF